MKYYTLFLEVVLFFALVFAEQKKFTYTPEVVALNKSNFDETVANAPQVIVKVNHIYELVIYKKREYDLLYFIY